jgi:hypothetical protein
MRYLQPGASERTLGITLELLRWADFAVLGRHYSYLEDVTVPCHTPSFIIGGDISSNR